MRGFKHSRDGEAQEVQRDKLSMSGQHCHSSSLGQRRRSLFFTKILGMELVVSSPEERRNSPRHRVGRVSHLKHCRDFGFAVFFGILQDHIGSVLGLFASCDTVYWHLDCLRSYSWDCHLSPKIYHQMLTRSMDSV